MILLVSTLIVLAGYLQVPPGPDQEREMVIEPLPQGPDTPQTRTEIEELMAVSERAFVENLGQLGNDEVLFYAKGSPLSAGFMRDGVMFILVEDEGPLVAYTMRFDGCNDVVPKGEGRKSCQMNHLRGRDPSNWVTGVRTLEEIWYRDIYDGIDCVFYFRDGMLKYDLLVGIGANADEIRLMYEGVTSLDIDPDSGDLLIVTEGGVVRDERPMLYSSRAGEALDTEASYSIAEDRAVEYDIPKADLVEGSFVIDPGLIWSTYIGGSGGDALADLLVDEHGGVYAVGNTLSVDFPTTPGVYDDVMMGDFEAVLIRLKEDGTDLEMATYIGGQNSDNAIALSFSPDGNILVLGITNSTDFPTTPDGIHTEPLGGTLDAFLIKVKADGTEVLYGTLFGGNSNEFPTNMKVLDDGTVYIFGMTRSTDLPVNQWSYNNTREINRTDYDCFVMRISSDLSSILNCTYLGGYGNEGRTRDYLEYSGFLNINDSGNVYVSDRTWSFDFPTTDSAVRTRKVGEHAEGFVSKFDANLSRLLASTYIGGSAYSDGPFTSTVSANGTVFVAGWTPSFDMPVTDDALRDNSTLNILGDNILMILDSNLSDVQYCTYMGGWHQDTAELISLGPSERFVYMAGETFSGDIRCTPGAFDNRNRGDWDTILWEFDLTTMNFTYTTYIGGQGEDAAGALFVDDAGYVYISAYTFSNDMFTLPSSFDRGLDGPFDSYLVKIDPDPCGPPLAPTNLTVELFYHNDEPYFSFAWDDPPFNGARPLEIYFYYQSVSGQSGYYSLDWDEKIHNWSGGGIPLLPVLEPGVWFNFRISLVNSAGEGPLSNVAGNMLKIEPTVPLDLKLGPNPTNGTVNITWQPPFRPGTYLPLNYTVWKGRSAHDLHPIANLTNQTFFTDTKDLVLGQDYYYAVSASNEVGDGPRTYPPERVVPVQSPTPPRSLNAVAGNMRVMLSWKPPEDVGGSSVLGYILYRGESPEELLEIARIGGNVNTHLDTNDLLNGKTYYYQLRAYTNVAPSTTSRTVNATPHTTPSLPTGLVAAPSDGRIDLTWDPPDDDGGSPIEGYSLIFGLSEDSLDNVIMVDDGLSCSQTGLTNGETIFYRIAARNRAGLGPLSELVNATPLGVPGIPRDLIVRAEGGVAILTWSPPKDWGGSTSLVYHVKRGTNVERQEPLTSLRDITSLEDDLVEPGTTYFYAVRAENPAGVGGSTDLVSVTVIMGPGSVGDLSWTSGDGWVHLTWTAPVDDGGGAITGYLIHKGISALQMADVAGLIETTWFNDTAVENGVTYLYEVLAVNEEGEGVPSDAVNATPYAHPNPPSGLTAQAKGDGVILSWGTNASQGTAPVTGYSVFRRTPTKVNEKIAHLGPVLTFTDTEVDPGNSYQYKVVAESDWGPSSPTAPIEVSIEPAEPEPTGPNWTWLALAILVLFGIASTLYLVGRRRAMVEEAGALALSSKAGVGALPLEEGKTSHYLVEELFVVHQDGRLIASRSREEVGSQDSEMMSGMLIAIQGIIQDGLQLGGTLEGIKYGDNNILLATGEHVILAAVIYGPPDEELEETLSTTVRFIETTYAGVIEDWTGEEDISSGIDDIIAPLLQMTGRLTRDDVVGDTTLQVVSILSAVDLFRGYLRLKVAAVNATTENIVDAAIELRYDRDMLRLAWVEPSSLRLKGDRVSLGNVKPRERKTVAFMFDPQMCQETDVDGTLTYYDSHGEFRSAEMKRRHARIICPVFTSAETANTAMLRRLVKDRLHQTDHRVLHYPGTLSPETVHELGKEVLDMSDLQMVSGFISDGRPRELETWYYGVTKVKGFQMVMRLGVVEEKRALELFVASTSLEPVTGLIAEFRRELERLYRERHPEGRDMELSHDEEERLELATRQLLIGTGERDENGGP